MEKHDIHLLQRFEPLRDEIAKKKRLIMSERTTHFQCLLCDRKAQKKY